MQTVIGQRLKSSRGRLEAASVVGVLIVIADLALVKWNHTETQLGRAALAIVALVVHLMLVEGDLTAVGLRLAPRQGWWYWVRIGLWLALGGAVIGLAMGVWYLSGLPMQVYATAPVEIGPVLLRMCVNYPLLEETLYRFALCVPLAALIGPWRTIVVNGLTFAYLHWLYGNPSPENQIGGFVLAWVYLKGESFLLPVLIHSVGNLGALGSQVAAWYWLGGHVTPSIDAF